MILTIVVPIYYSKIWSYFPDWCIGRVAFGN